MKNILLLFSVIFMVINGSFEYVPTPTCFGQICPSSTTNCKQHKQSNPDKNRIEITITCLDESDANLKDYYFEEASNLDRYTSYQNTKYESINEGISTGAQHNPIDLTPYDNAGYFK